MCASMHACMHAEAYTMHRGPTHLADVHFGLQLPQRGKLVWPRDALVEDAHLGLPVGLLVARTTLGTRDPAAPALQRLPRFRAAAHSLPDPCRGRAGSSGGGAGHRSRGGSRGAPGGPCRRGARWLALVAAMAASGGSAWPRGPRSGKRWHHRAGCVRRRSPERAPGDVRGAPHRWASTAKLPGVATPPASRQQITDGQDLRGEITATSAVCLCCAPPLAKQASRRRWAKSLSRQGNTMCKPSAEELQAPYWKDAGYYQGHYQGYCRGRRRPGSWLPCSARCACAWGLQAVVRKEEGCGGMGAGEQGRPCASAILACNFCTQLQLRPCPAVQ